MSKRPALGYDSGPEDTFQNFLEGAAKLLFWGGLFAVVASTIFLIFTYVTFAGSTQASMDQALSNLAIFTKVIIVGMVATAIGSTFMFWGEETLGAFQLIGGGIFYFAPLLIPSVSGLSGGKTSEVADRALGAIQTGGMVFGALAICVLVTDILVRIRVRSMQGARSDQLKYGKGIKEERDIQNVFMGQCWQLPYCRKFVRERCPIFHAKRTCWRERVGCMCEEEVIRNAMENKPVPKDALAAAAIIPYNKKLPLMAKIQRCKQCVIYNEHQKHKYRLALPLVLVFYGALIGLLYNPLMGAMALLIGRVDKIVGVATYREAAPGKAAVFSAPFSFQVILLACFAVVCLTYSLRLIEYLIFKAKV